MKRYAISAALIAMALTAVSLSQVASPRSSRAEAAGSQATVFAAGILRDPQGEPVANGFVHAYPTTAGSDWSGTVAPVSTAVADGDGRFTLTLSHRALATLQRDAAGNGGVANLDAVADDGGELAGVTGFTLDVGSLGSRGKVRPVPAAIAVDMEGPSLPARTAKRGKKWHCPTPGTVQTKVIRRFKRWVQVGEANSAYRDSNASFTYGRSADTDASKGISVNGGFFKISGGTHVGNSRSAAVGASTAGQGQMRVMTRFKYKEGRSRWCNQVTHRHYQRFGLAPVRWIKRVRHSRQHNALHRCPRQAKLVWRRHTQFSRTRHRFERYHHGFSIGPSFRGFGIEFHGSGTSGASEFARLHMSFGGGIKRHYACGPHGRSPFRGKRVFSGARH